MSESKFETVSALVDNYQQSEQSLDDLIKDEALSDTWDSYHLIGDILRNDISQTVQLNISAQIADAIAKEPTVLAPKASVSLSQQFKAKVIQLAKPFGQVAIAASAAGLMVLGVQQNVADSDTLMPNQVVQTMPLAGIADPVSFNYQPNERLNQKKAYVEQQIRFQALLSDHQQQIKFNSLVKTENTINNADLNKVEESPK